MVLVLTGKDYAEMASVKTDWATADYMRRVMFGALKEWKKLPEDQKTGETGAKKARELLIKAACDDEMLKKIGTAEIVAEYYKYITDPTRESGPNKIPPDIVGFLNSVKPEDVDGIDKGMKERDITKLLAAATAFSDGGKKFLQVEPNLTYSYQHFLETHKNELEKIILPTPQAFTPEEIVNTYQDMKLFRTLDYVDDKLSSIYVANPFGNPLKPYRVGSPGVSDRLADFSSNEILITRVLTELPKLKSDDPAKIKDGLTHLKVYINPAADISTFKTPEQLDVLVNNITKLVYEIRTETPFSNDMGANLQHIKGVFSESAKEAGQIKEKAPHDVSIHDVRSQPHVGQKPVNKAPVHQH